MSNLIDLTGQRFGRLLVLKKGKMASNGQTTWICKCDCGTIKQIRGVHLKSGKIISCGCYHLERIKETKHTTHGKTGTRIYNIWCLMKKRCGFEKSINYHNYGKRGIKVCDEWLNNFNAFYDWAMANGYTDKLSIERIDNNGNYEPNNCKWATRQEQNNNTRRNRFIIVNGEKLTLAQISRKYNINKNTLWGKLNHNLPIEEILGITNEQLYEQNKENW